MGRKKETPQQRLEHNVRELEESYRHWEDLSLHGGNDPFWPDGVNLNLVRNHTTYYKTKIKECCDELNIPCPEIYFRDPPPEMDSNYYAKRKEITARAQQTIDRIKRDYPPEQYPADSRFCRNFRQFQDDLENGELAAVRNCGYDFFEQLAQETSPNDHGYEENKETGQLGLFASQTAAETIRKTAADSTRRKKKVKWEILFQTYLKIITSGENVWQSFLRSCAQLYKHNWVNQVMIYGQFKTATYVADEATWKKVGRAVIENGVAIATLTTKGGRVGYEYLYDISQTEGRDLSKTVDVDRFHTTEEERERLRLALINKFGASQSMQIGHLMGAIAAAACQKNKTEETAPYQPLLQASVLTIVCAKLGIPVPDQRFHGLEKVRSGDLLLKVGVQINKAARTIFDQLEKELNQIRREEHVGVSSEKRADHPPAGTPGGSERTAVPKVRDINLKISGGVPAGTLPAAAGGRDADGENPGTGSGDHRHGDSRPGAPGKHPSQAENGGSASGHPVLQSAESGGGGNRRPGHLPASVVRNLFDEEQER